MTGTEAIRESVRSLRMARAASQHSDACSSSRLLCGELILAGTSLPADELRNLQRILIEIGIESVGPYQRNIRERAVRISRVLPFLGQPAETFVQRYLRWNAMVHNLLREIIIEDPSEGEHGVRELAILSEKCLESHVEIGSENRDKLNEPRIMRSWKKSESELTLALGAWSECEKSVAVKRSRIHVWSALTASRRVAEITGVPVNQPAEPVDWLSVIPLSFTTAWPIEIPMRNELAEEEAWSELIPIAVIGDSEVPSRRTEADSFGGSQMHNEPVVHEDDCPEKFSETLTRLGIERTTAIRALLSLLSDGAIDPVLSDSEVEQFEKRIAERRIGGGGVSDTAKRRGYLRHVHRRFGEAEGRTNQTVDEPTQGQPSSNRGQLKHVGRQFGELSALQHPEIAGKEEKGD